MDGFGEEVTVVVLFDLFTCNATPALALPM
jgi:hypothetical protein